MDVLANIFSKQHDLSTKESGRKCEEVPGVRREKPICLDDTIEFSKCVDVIPQSVIEEYTTPQISKKFTNGKGSARGKDVMDTSWKSTNQSLKSMPKRLGLGSSASRSTSTSKQLFHSPGIEVRPIKKGKTLGSNKYKQFNLFSMGSLSHTLSPVFKFTNPKEKAACFNPKADVLERSIVCEIMDKYSEDLMPHTEELQDVIVIHLQK
ncbi:hypothetical protein RIF29_34194 [Crotalaria pallida]|uniref:Uncharacterized protein n=1 Tax=Crotalaria pallida TaxID=3830 RepID=A0AAN9EBF2_CROPI